MSATLRPVQGGIAFCCVILCSCIGDSVSFVDIDDGVPDAATEGGSGDAGPDAIIDGGICERAPAQSVVQSVVPFCDADRNVEQVARLSGTFGNATLTDEPAFFVADPLFMTIGFHIDATTYVFVAMSRPFFEERDFVATKEVLLPGGGELPELPLQSANGWFIGTANDCDDNGAWLAPPIIGDDLSASTFHFFVSETEPMATLNVRLEGSVSEILREAEEGLTRPTWLTDLIDSEVDRVSLTLTLETTILNPLPACTP